MIRKIIKRLKKQGVCYINFRQFSTPFFGFLLLFYFVFSINSCEKTNPVEPINSESNFNTSSGLNALPDTSTNRMFPMFNSETFYYIDSLGYYEGGNIKFAGNLSKFNLEYGALTPPAATRKGYGVTITMRIEYDQINNELIFEFRPHGCRFNPGAQVKLDYNPLGIDVACLYYIDENGNYIQQTPDYIDINNN